MEDLLPSGVRTGRVDNLNGLEMFYLEAGSPDAPVLLLLHGFPELGFSWRKVMTPLAAAGYRVIAPDQRGYGRTTGWNPGFEDPERACRMLNLATDALGLLKALDIREAAAVVGHDFGSPVAAHCALIRPDIFRRAALMSAPFGGPPPLEARRGSGDIHADLAALPRPRKHYQWYYVTPEADRDMLDAPQGLHDFLRAYYHAKSGDWPGNRPRELAAWSADELAKLPAYYVMDRDAGMAETVAPDMPTPEEIAACGWLTDAELAVYVEAFRRTGFQCALNWYRNMTDPAYLADMRVFAGRRLDVPACFIAGARDWGIHQRPGALQAMAERACADWRGTTLIDGAGHWVQQERPEAVVGALLDFLAD
ncbi:alpha/beta fold hydrolase [Minwuia thermotolerans]|uniref:Alpha/beta hydrolase n=1 Tax=Minwuia thermotolerans TaxID=2056226 RepID=A0A2M9FWC9_9PROT|nr:alpha/beta hydrolase [Minwuia thermotolerans]PJK27778.1 alpha/beta hydrolase [Minwuia thermotolerans]